MYQNKRRFKAMMIDKESPIPCYYQVYEDLLHSIENCDYSADNKLPSERILSEKFNVNRFTVRRAIKKLIEEGLVYPIRRKGYFVKAYDIDIDIDKNTSYTNMMKKNHMKPKIEIIELETQDPTPELEKLFKLTKPEKVWSIYILRYYDNIPYTLSRIYLSYKRFPKLNLYLSKNTSLYSILSKEYGITTKRKSSICEACITDKSESKHLSVLGGFPLLKVTSVAEDNFGMPVEQSISKFRSDMVKVKINL